MKPKLPPLPRILRRAHEIGGIDAVVKLSRALGGRYVAIPLNPVGANHPLSIAGEKVAQMLVEEFGGAHVEIPKGGAHLRVLIAAQVIERKGSNNDIAQEAGVTWRHAKKLRRIVRGGAKMPARTGRPVRRDPAQIDLEGILKR